LSPSFKGNAIEALSGPNGDIHKTPIPAEYLISDPLKESSKAAPPSTKALNLY
jgi:hypothetical protein